MLAGSDAFQPCALTPATLRAPRAAAMKHAAMRIARQGTSRVFMVCVSVCQSVSVRVCVPVFARWRRRGRVYCLRILENGTIWALAVHQ